MPAFRGHSRLVPLAIAGLTLACGGGTGDHPTGAPHVACADCVQAGGRAGAGGVPIDASGAGGATDGGMSANEAGASADAGAGGAADSGGAPAIDDGVAISEVSFWQALRVPLELGGEPAPSNAPIITNKEGILRVYVAPGSLFRARQLTATLVLGAGAPLTSTKLVRVPSADGDFATTFNFPIDAASVGTTSQYSVALLDGPSGPELGRYPLVGQSALAAVSAGKTLNVVVVPIVVAGLMPDVSESTLATFRSRVLSMYPLGDFTITAHAPLVSNVVVGPDAGWDQLLDALYALRARDAPAANVYYFGLFTPTKRFDQYCVTDCTVGLSNVAGPDEVESRGSIGLGIFSDGSNSDAPDTMAHELGHALGRKHSPCGGATGIDRAFPYEGGKIGAWGFDSRNHLLLDPAVYGDVMGYCTPDWVSDYTYSALFDRIQYVNASVTGTQALSLRAAASVYRRVLVGAQGTLRWGSRFTPSHGPQGEPRAVTLLAADGTAVGGVTGYFQPFSDAAGGFLSVPESALEASSGIAAIGLGGAELALDAPKP